MTQIVFLLEELSAKVLLDEILPKLLPEGVRFRCIPHDGKNDLAKSIPIKLRNWREPDTWFVIIRDKDLADGPALKSELCKVCANNDRPETLVRIVVHELESWILGDLAAVAKAYNMPRLAETQQKVKFRNPDNLPNPSEELAKLVKGYQKVSGARNVAPHLSLGNNVSKSFQVFEDGLAAYVESIISKK